MKPRPISVTILSLLMLVVGAAGFVYHARRGWPWPPIHSDLILVCSVSLAAVVCGVYMLRGCNWARWLTLAWMAFHVAISALHSAGQAAAHSLFLVIFIYLLFRPAARAYFAARA